MSSSGAPVFLPIFRRDIQDTIAWSYERFGAAAAERYAALIRQALQDVLLEPTRAGAQPRPELAPHAYVYHLLLSRDRVMGAKVKSPRHFILYRYKPSGPVEFARLLHESRDLARHWPHVDEEE